jgi:hypothetical protein
MQVGDALIQPKSIEGCLSNWYQNLSQIVALLGIEVCTLEQGAFVFRYWARTQQLRLFRIWRTSAQWCEFSVANFDFWPHLDTCQPDINGAVIRPLKDGWLSLCLMASPNSKTESSAESTLAQQWSLIDVKHPLLSMPLTQFPVRMTKYESDLLSISYQVLVRLKAHKHWCELDCAQALLMTPQYVFGAFQKYLSSDPKACRLSDSSVENEQGYNQTYLVVAQSIALADMFLHKINRGEHPLDAFEAISRMPMWRVHPELVAAFHCVLLGSDKLSPVTETLD